jgi:hypothetical protein
MSQGAVQLSLPGGNEEGTFVAEMSLKSQNLTEQFIQDQNHREGGSIILERFAELLLFR